MDALQTPGSEAAATRSAPRTPTARSRSPRPWPAWPRSPATSSSPWRSPPPRHGAGRRSPARSPGRPSPAGLLAAAPLWLGTVAGDGAVRDAFATQHDLRLPAAPCMALALAGLAAAPALPRALARTGPPLAAVLAVIPLAWADGAMILFGLHALWIAAASLWLRRRPGARPARARPPRRLPRPRRRRRRRGPRAARAPGRGRDLLRLGAAPTPLAAFAGGVYVGSAVAYGVALGCRQARRGRSRRPPRCSRRASSPSRSRTSSRSTSGACRPGRGSSSSRASPR